MLLRKLGQVLARHLAFPTAVLEEPPPPAEGLLLCCFGPETLAVPGFDPGEKPWSLHLLSRSEVAEVSWKECH